MTWAQLARSWRRMLKFWIALVVFCLGGALVDILLGQPWAYAAFMIAVAFLATERFRFCLPKYRVAVSKAREEENDRAFLDTLRSVDQWKRQSP